jgi:hypothetical protein
MKLIIVLRIFAFMLFLFIPSIALMMFAAFILKSTTWFQLLGLPALLINGVIVIARPSREKIGQKLRAIAMSK